IALLAQSAERRLGMSEAAGSKPAESSSLRAEALRLAGQRIPRRLPAGLSAVALAKAEALAKAGEKIAPVAQRQRQHVQAVPSASSNLARRTSLRALRALRLGKPSRARRGAASTCPPKPWRRRKPAGRRRATCCTAQFPRA